MILTGTYDVRLVALSFLVAVMTSYTALDLTGRVTASGGRTRALWLAGGAMAMGLGIWSMHFVAMLAYRLPVPMPYHVTTVLLSLLVAVAASGLALFTVSRRTLGTPRLLIGGALMGSAIASMHYIGMAGMRAHATIRYDLALVALSILIAIGASLAALRIAFWLRGGSKAAQSRLMTAASLAMGVAISGMHYTGMAAAEFVATGHSVAPSSLAADTSFLGAAAIAAGTLVVLGFALLTALVDRRMAARAAEAEVLRRSEERLRAEIAERERAEERLRTSEANLVDAQRLAHIGSWETDPATGEMYWSDESYRIFGYGPGGVEPTVDLFLSHVHPDDREALTAAVPEALRSGEKFHRDYRIVRRDGAERAICSTFEAVHEDAGKPGRLRGTNHDVTERRRAEEALRSSEERFRSLVQNAADVIAVLDAGGAILYESPAVERLLGYRQEEMVGRSAFDPDLVHPEDAARVHTLFSELVMSSGGSVSTEIRVRHADGSWRSIEAVGTNMLDDPAVAGIVVNYRDVTERRAYEERLRHQAFHDPLTGLPNRALFMDRLEHALLRGVRRQGSVAVLYVDTDRFKFVNDSLGHGAGDRLLVAMAQRLRACLRPEDTAARPGGDEFTVLLEDVEDEAEAERVAERIAEALSEPFDVAGHEVVITTSVGIALNTAQQRDPAELLRAADTAMYRAKRTGKARHAVYDARMGSHALELLELEADLRRAIERGELRLHYQPKVELATGRIVGVEALLRWEHPGRGMVPPDEFIALAEETGLILPIGRWILAEACRQARAWRDRQSSGPALEMCVNVSARQFVHADLVAEVAERNAATLRDLTDLGVRLAIDDFGTGYSSLAYLHRFPVDLLKIDRSFVDGLGRESEDTAIVRAVIGLARSLRLEVVAEGVETVEQSSRLRALGCRYAQGYLFSEPLRSEEVEALLRSASLQGMSARGGNAARPAP